MESETPYITNQETARVLFQVASLLEMMEANPFRVRTYRRAALGVLFLPRPLVEYVEKGESIPLPGLGDRLRGRLAELVNTGHLGAYDALREEVGEPMMSLLQVYGVGPKTAIRLISELHVSSLGELVEAAQAGKIQSLRGFGPKREAQIAAAAESLLGAAA